MSESDFQNWLQARHAKMATLPELIESWINKATSSSIASSKRLVVGQMNEVYDMVTSSGQKIIVRISRAEDPRFEAERWALDAARQWGVPTPKVLLIEHVKTGDEELAVCIEEKLPGTPLDQLLKQKPIEEQDISIEQIGKALAAIHSVKVKGFGYLQPSGEGWDIPFSNIMLDLLEQRSELLAAAKQWDVPDKQIDAALKLLGDNKELYEWNDPRLVHGDFVAQHILVENGNVTGLIDFQECSANHPVVDFVQWFAGNHYLKHPIPLEALKEAYPDKALFDETFEPLFHLALLRRSLWMLMVHVEHENPHGVRYVKEDLEKALKFFAKSVKI